MEVEVIAMADNLSVRFETCPKHSLEEPPVWNAWFEGGPMVIDLYSPWDAIIEAIRAEVLARAEMQVRQPLVPGF